MTQIIISTGGGDQCADSAGDYYTTDNVLYLGHDTGTGDTHRQNAWIPFVVNLPQGKQITSAVLQFYATQTRSDTIDVHIGCEDVDDSDTPSDGADCRGRTLTTNYTSYAPSGFTAGTQYEVDITDAVQEVLDRAGWAANNVLAVLWKSQSTGSNDWRRLVASWDNVTYDEPKLVIDFDSFVPQAVWLA